MSENEPRHVESETPRTTYEVEQDIRDAYASVLKNHNLGPEAIIEAIRDLDSSRNWPDFARKQNINPLRIEPGTHSEKIMLLVREYYKLKDQEEGR